MLNFAEKINTTSIWGNLNFQPGNDKVLTKDKIITYLQNLINAQYLWVKYKHSKNKAAIEGIDTILNKSIGAYSTYYNNYLLAKYYNVSDKNERAVAAANIALAINKPSSLYFNRELRTELKMVTNIGFDIYDEAYMGISELEQNIGNVNYGEKKQIRFEVENKGKKDLRLKKVITDCECTVVNYPKIAIKPGKTADINVSFIGKRPGNFTHLIELGSNAENAPITLYIRGITLGDK